MGFALHISWEPVADRDAYVQQAADAGAGTIREGFAWSGVEAVRGTDDWSFTDQQMRLTASRHMSLVAMLGSPPRWASSCPESVARFDRCAPADDADYARFAAAVADRYRKGGAFWAENPDLPYVPLAGVEIWNEPNKTQFWVRPDASRYASLVIAAYAAIKAEDPSLTVLAGSLAPAATVPGASVNPIEFLRRMYAAGAGGSFDALSDHPYAWATGRTPAQTLAADSGSGWAQMYETTPSLRSVMVANGDADKQIWATELGAPTSSEGVTEAEQAALASEMVRRWRSLPWTGNFYWYDLRDDCDDPGNRECRFGVVRRDGSLKPSYEALQEAFAG